MKDFLGQELHIGDMIVGIAHHSASSVLFGGTIKRMTNKKLIVNVLKYDKIDEWRFTPRFICDPEKIKDPPEKQIYPDKVIKVNNLGENNDESS